MTVEWELIRVAPPQSKGERILLEPGKDVYVVGRSASCDIRLFSPSASREHAEMRRDAKGCWRMAPRAGKHVLADGEPVEEPLELCEGLSLVMGSDKLRCRAPAAGVDEPVAQGEQAAAQRPGSLLWVAGGLALVLLVLTAWRVMGG